MDLHQLWRKNSGLFCEECGAEKTTWLCPCGSLNAKKFCPKCGKSYEELNEIYANACDAFEKKDFTTAVSLFESLKAFKNSKEYRQKSYYEIGIANEQTDPAGARDAFIAAGDYLDSESRAQTLSSRAEMLALIDQCDWEVAYQKAKAVIEQDNPTSEEVAQFNECAYNYGNSLLGEERYLDAYIVFSGIPEYKDVGTILQGEALKDYRHDVLHDVDVYYRITTEVSSEDNTVKPGDSIKVSYEAYGKLNGLQYNRKFSNGDADVTDYIDLDYNLATSRSQGEFEITVPEYPDTVTLRFIAYVPADRGNYLIDLGREMRFPVIGYTAPEPMVMTVEYDQKDMVAGNTVEIKYHATGGDGPIGSSSDKWGYYLSVNGKQVGHFDLGENPGTITYTIPADATEIEYYFAISDSIGRWLAKFVTIHVSPK